MACKASSNGAPVDLANEENIQQQIRDLLKHPSSAEDVSHAALDSCTRVAGQLTSNGRSAVKPSSCGVLFDI
jgi:hypothetical protein